MPATEKSEMDVPELVRAPFGAPTEAVAQLVERDGGVILTGVISPADVEAINSELDPYFSEVNKGNFSDGDKNWLAEFFGGKTKRLVHCVKFSKTLREAFLNNVTLKEYISATLPGADGTHTMYSSQAIEIHPGEKAQELHRDGGGLGSFLGAGGPAGANLLTNTLLALCNVTEELGATRVIPKSNHWSDFSQIGTQDQTIGACLNEGDVLLINGKVLHGGGSNRTKDRKRRVLSTAFAPGIIIGEEAWPHVLTREEVEGYPVEVQRLLGFRSISYRGENPGFLWRANARPLEEYLGI